MEPYLDIDINIGNQFHPHQSQAQSHTQTQQSQTQQSNSAGLLRFRSAPSSLLSSCKPNPPQYPNPEFVHQGDLLSGVSSSLTRQTSSPPGFLSQLNHSHLPTNGGYGMVRGVGNLRAANGAGGDSSRLKPQTDFPTPHGRLPRIPELGSETTDTKETSSPSDPNNHRCRNVDEDDATRFCQTTACSGFAFASSWNNPSEGSSGHQQNDKVLLFSGLDDASASSLENGSLPHCTHMLSHHLSLPKTSAEMAAVEKLLNYQDTIPCKIRAKRGCATHPRSIAERVRRTRISERMKKLQDLVPNMDKQVNTADMLDLAVEYIKELQKQYTALNDNRARCECIHLKQYAAVDKTC